MSFLLCLFLKFGGKHMNSTAIGAMNNTESEKKISFISEAHERFFYEKLSQVRYQDEYHISLIYCLGINADTRQHIDRIYDFKSGLVKPACLHEGWVTSGSARVIRIAFNLYCDGTPSVKCTRQKIAECQNYSVSELFCCSYAPFFWVVLTGFLDVTWTWKKIKTEY